MATTITTSPPITVPTTTAAVSQDLSPAKAHGLFVFLFEENFNFKKRTKHRSNPNLNGLTKLSC
jgi:hypothetical protein